MYCSNCGKKVDEKAVICVGCGVPLNNNYNVAANKPKRGKGIASMVLGILAVLYNFSAIGVISTDLEEELLFKTSSYQVGFGFGLVLIPLVLAIVGLCLACSERKHTSNGFNTAGLWLTLITLVLAAIEFLYVATY